MLRNFFEVLQVRNFLQVEFCSVSTFVDTAPRSSSFSLLDVLACTSSLSLACADLL